MANIVIIPLAREVGHLNPTVALARALERRGHHVCYWALKDLEKNVHQQALRYEPLFEHVRLEIPPGRGWLGQHPLSQLFRELRAQIPWNNTMLDLMLSGQAAEQLRGLRPDVVLVDNMWPQLALVARALKLPVALLGTTPAFHRGQAPSGFAGRMGELFVGWLSRVLGLRFRDATRALAQRCGLPETSFDLDTLLPRFIGPELPELLLYPPDLEGAGAAPGVHVGPSVDVERAEPPFDCERVPAENDLFYCALGTRDLPSQNALAVFRPIIEAVSRRPRSTLVLAAGAHAHLVGTVPENVLVVDRAPQLALLRRAKLMFTHGGLGSVKECLYFQVPMIVFPLRFDQQANAAWVHREKLGITLTGRRRTAATISQAIDTVLGDPIYRANVAATGGRLRSEEQQAAAIAHVEALLGSQSGAGVAALPSSA